MVDVEHLNEIARNAAALHGCDVVQVSYRREQPGWVLRVLIERRDADPAHGSGVDHSLCSAVSRDLGNVLDVEDAIADSFTLEVSSPGIERPLTRPEDYARFAGKKARVETSAPVAGRRRHAGRIVGVKGEEVALEQGDGGVVAIPFAKVAKAHLVFDTDEVISKAGEK